MSKGSKGSWDLPSYSKSGVINFANPYGTTRWTQGGEGSGTNAGTWDFAFNPSGQKYYDDLTTMRNSIMSGLGFTSPAREASLNEWQDTFARESARTSMPQLEQTLFSRGMGGSRLYQGAVTDLLSKIATQSVLNRENLAMQDENLKLSQLAAINPMITDLLNRSDSYVNSAYGATEKQYENLFPYLANYNQKKGNLDTWGQIAGLALAVGAAPFTGGASLALAPTMMGAGGSIGGMFNQGPSSGMDLSSLGMLASGMPTSWFGGQQYANVGGMGKVPVAPQNYYLKQGAF